MELKKEVKYQVSVTPTNIIEVVRITTVMEGDKQLGNPEYHRHCLQVGSDLSNESDIVKKIAEAVWTPEVINNYKKSIEEAEDI